jgi:predicted dehydrogenase
MYKLNRPIQLGILGCGSFIQRRILPILKTIDVLSIVALQKRNLFEAKQIAEKYNIPHAVSTRDELLKLPQVEAVLIATPNHMHEQDALACASYLKPTLCEKPLAPSASAIEKMIKAFQKQDLPLYVGQSLRFKFCLQKAKQLLQSGRLGQLLSIRAHFSIPLHKDNWRHRKAQGGGVLQDIGVHLIDLIRFISGQEIYSIFSQANHDYQIAAPEAEQTVTAICRLTDQSISSFECSFTHPFSSGFEVIGNKARLVSNDSLRQSDNSNETFCLIENDTKSYLPIPLSNIYFDELIHFVDSIQGSPSIISAEEGLQNQKVIDAAYHSIQKGSYIQVR